MIILITCIGSAPQSAICRTLKKDNYNIIGIDTQELCIGNFVCDKFITSPKVSEDNYNKFIENLLEKYKINCIFVGHRELLFFSKYKKEYKEKFNCDIFVNDQNFIDIANNKNKTYDFCINNDINIPKKCDISYRPCIVKPINGYGSIGLKILKTVDDQDIIVDDSFIIQEFIEGEEYTVDILSDTYGNFIVAVPKKRLLVKNGQSFKSIVCKDESVISFCRDICEKMNNKSAINIQVIKQKNTGKIFLIEINPRFATTINLSIEAGINMPQMMIENNYVKCDYEDGLVMVRDYKEYFVCDRKKIFITGGAGFIGSNLVHYLCKYTNHDITVYDNLSTVNCGLENIKELIDSEKINFIKGDILDEDLLSSSIKGYDIVIHLAAQLEITASYKNQIYDLNINLIGTINIINCCIKHNIKRLINASSACVYGFTEGKSSKENDQTNPNWEYGITKLAAEKYIQVASNTYGLKYTSLRFSIVYGKNEWYGRVLPIFIKRALEGKDLVIFGDGNQTRDYINVLDCVKFIEECINNKNTYNQVFNVSSGKNRSIKELALKIKNIFKNIDIVYEDVKQGEVSKLVEGRERLNQELKHLYLDNTKAKKSTNWKPSVDFDKSLYDYISWIKFKHKDYWTYLKC